MTTSTDTRAASRGGDLRLGVIADLHLGDPGSEPSSFNNPVRRGESEELLRQSMAWLAARSDAWVLLGDLADGPAARHYKLLARRLASVETPVYAVLGNHDMSGSYSPARRTLADQVTFLGRTVVGRHVLMSGPLSEHAGAHVQRVPGGLSAGRWTPAAEAPPTPEKAAGPLLVWAAHFPVLSLRDEIEARGWLYAGDLANRDHVQLSLRRYPGPVLALSGHLHVRSHAIAGNILQLTAGALAEAPHEASVVEVAATPGRVQVTRRCQSFRPSPGAVVEPGATLDGPLTAFSWKKGRWRQDPRPMSGPVRKPAASA
jgi:predicted phosphodiesterase